MEKNFREFAKYASMNVMGMMGLSCYILADTFFIAQGLGAAGLAALNLAIPVYSAVHGTGLMLGMGGATKYAILKGQGVRESGSRMFTDTVAMAALLAVFFMTAGLLGAGTLTRALGADADVFNMTETYLRVILLFSPAFMANDILLCFIRNDGNPRLAMTAMLSGSFSNIILDYVFIFPMQMGIFGAVLATGFAPLISMAVMSSHFIKKKHGFFLQKTLHLRRDAGAIFTLGFPSMVLEVASGLVIIIFNLLIMNLEGNVGVAAYGVITNLSLVVISIFTGIAQGMQPLTSRSYGQGKREETVRLLRYGLVTSFAIAVILYGVMFFFADPIALVFNSERNEALQEMAVYGMRLYFTGIFFAGINVVLSMFFTSTELALQAHGISLMRGLILIAPLAVLFARLGGMTGVWLAFPVTEALTAGFGWIFYKTGNKKKLALTS